MKIVHSAGIAHSAKSVAPLARNAKFPIAHSAKSSKILQNCCVFAERCQLQSSVTAEGMYLIAQGLHIAAEGLFMSAQSLDIGTQGLHMQD